MADKQGFYGMRIVIGSLIITVFSMAIINNTAAFYMTPICVDLGFSTGQFSVSYSMAALGAAAGAMLAGSLIRKMPIRVLMLIGVLVSGLAFGGLAIATKLWHFYVLLFLADAGMAFFTNVPLTTMLNSWYVDKRGMMTGLVFAGAGLGSIFLSPVTENLIQSIGWQSTALISGAVILATALPVCALVFYKSPADVGQKPFTYPEGSQEALKAAAKAEGKVKKSADPNSGVAKKQALRSPAFLLLAAGLLCMGMVCSGVMVHIPNFLYDLKMNAGFVMSVLAIGRLIGTFVTGMATDKMGIVRTLLVSTTLFALGMVCLYFTGSAPALAYIMAVLVGASVCIGGVGPPLLTSIIFGTKDYPALYSLNFCIFLVGCIAGPVVCGIIYDASGYNLVWLVYIIIAALMFICIAAAVKAGAALMKKIAQQTPEDKAVEPTEVK